MACRLIARGWSAPGSGLRTILRPSARCRNPKVWWAASGLHTRCPWPALLGCSDSRRLVDHAPQRRCDRSARRSNLRSRRALRVCHRPPYLDSLSAPRGDCMRCCSATCAMAAQTGAGAAGSCPVQSELLVHAVAQGWTKQVGTCFSQLRHAAAAHVILYSAYGHQQQGEMFSADNLAELARRHCRVDAEVPTARPHCPIPSAYSMPADSMGHRSVIGCLSALAKVFDGPPPHFAARSASGSLFLVP